MLRVFPFRREPPAGAILALPYCMYPTAIYFYE